MLHTNLSIKSLKLATHIGCCEEERAKSQIISIDFIIRFHEPPKACETDNLNDAVCYAELSQCIRDYCSKNTFALIEHLGAQLYKLLKSELPEHTMLWLQVTKTQPLADLNESSFSIGDWEHNT
jgi:dihydroneopterin aldolase